MQGVARVTLCAVATLIIISVSAPASMVWGSEWRPGQISLDSLPRVEGASSFEAATADVANHLLADDDDEDDERDEDDDDDEHDDERDEDDEDDDDEREGKDHDGDDERDEEHDHKKHKHGKDKDEKHKGRGHEKDKDDDSSRGKGKDKDKKEPPNPQAITVNEDSFVRIVLERNYASLDSVTFAILERPGHGSLDELNSTSGEVTYRPSSNYFGDDSFAFVVREGDRDSKPSTVEIRVKGVNDAPVAAGIQFTTREDRSFSFVLKGSDVDGDELRFIIVSDPSHGELTGTAPSLSYTPDRRFDGVDNFTFKVSDGTLESNLASVAITVKEDGDNNRSGQKSQPATKPVAPAVVDQSVGVVTPTSFEPPLTVSPVESPITTLPSSIGVVDSAVVLGGPTVAAIKDLVSPQLIFPAATVEAIATSLEGTIVNYSVRATDDTDGEVETSCSPNSGSKFPIGRFNVVCYATDAAGNSALSSFVVVVRPDVTGENVLPAFLLPSVLAAVLGAGAFVGLRMYRKGSLT